MYLLRLNEVRNWFVLDAIEFPHYIKGFKYTSLAYWYLKSSSFM